MSSAKDWALPPSATFWRGNHEGADLVCQGTATAQSDYYGEVGKGAEKRSALGYSERILGVM